MTANPTLTFEPRCLRRAKIASNTAPNTAQVQGNTYVRYAIGANDLRTRYEFTRGTVVVQCLVPDAVDHMKPGSMCVLLVDVACVRTLEYVPRAGLQGRRVTRQQDNCVKEAVARGVFRGMYTIYIPWCLNKTRVHDELQH